MKLTKIFRLSLVILVSALTFSCSQISQPSADEVMAKMQSGETLEAADYETMLDYLEEFCDAGEASDNSYESGREIGEQYPYFMSFALVIDNAPKEVKEEERFEEVEQRFKNLMNR